MSNNSQNKENNNNFDFKIIFDKYIIGEKIGKGSFGTVFTAINKGTNEKVAIKTELNDNKNQIGLLEQESLRLNSLKGFLGILNIYEYGKLKRFNVLVMELLGKSLGEIFLLKNKKFSLKTVSTLGIDMIKLIKHIHENQYLHRDIKPDNFMMGREKKKDILYIIDFGLAKKYITSNNQHIPFKIGKSITGTARYCSIYTHQGMEQSRRDDLESIGYVLMYFLRGDLPWQGIKVKENEKHYERIGNMKQNISIDELCFGFPEQFKNYFNYVKQLEFDEDPNYNFLIELFEMVLKKICNVKYMNYNNNKRGILFDWNDGINYLDENIIVKSKSSRNYYTNKLKDNHNNMNQNHSNHTIGKKDKRRNSDSSFNNIKDTKDDTNNDDNNENKKKNKINKDVHCQCFVF